MVVFKNDDFPLCWFTQVVIPPLISLGVPHPLVVLHREWHLFIAEEHGGTVFVAVHDYRLRGVKGSIQEP